MGTTDQFHDVNVALFDCLFCGAWYANKNFIMLENPAKSVKIYWSILKVETKETRWVK